MGIHTHELSLPAGEMVVLSAATGPAHVHTGSHPHLGGDFTTSQADDTPDHTHRVVTMEQNFQTGRPIGVDPDISSTPQDQAIERNHVAPVYPAVLKWDSVRDGSLPELGQSGLPESLERGIPGRYRYWQADTVEDALAIRRALVASRIASEENTRTVQVKSGSGLSEPVLMRVERDGERLVPIQTTQDTSGPLTPTFPSDIELASKAAGIEPDRVLDDSTIGALMGFGRMEAGDVLAGCMESGADWLIQIRAGSELEKALNDLDLTGAYRLNHSDEFVYLASSIPRDGVRFVAEPTPLIKGALERTQTLTGTQITDRLESVSLGSAHERLSKYAADMADRSEWSTWDLRVASRIKSVLDRESARDEMRIGLIKALGLDHDAAGQEVLKRTNRVRIRKFADLESVGDERLVFGVVLEPDQVDLQRDVVSADDIATAFYNYVEYYLDRGVQHLEIDNGGLRITQQYLAPCDFVPKGCDSSELIREGSWVMEYRVVSDELWAAVRRGEFTGFSIGGTGTRIPID